MSGIDETLTHIETKMTAWKTQAFTHIATFKEQYPKVYEQSIKIAPLALAIIFTYISPIATVAGIVAKTVFPTQINEAVVKFKAKWDSYGPLPQSAALVISLAISHSLYWVPPAAAAGAFAAHKML